MTTTTKAVTSTNGARAPATPAPRNVTEAISRVMGSLPGIGKDDRADPRQGGYAYRGIEAITRAVQPLFAKHGVVLVPRVHSHEVVNIDVGGKPWTDTRLLVSYTAYGPGGPEDRVEVGPILGIGRDNSDKGANKAMTQAYKYALLQLLAVSDSKDDGDAASVGADSPAPRGRPERPPAEPWWDKLGYPDEHEARTMVDGVNALMPTIPAGRRGPVREWLESHGYRASTPVLVRAEHVTELEGLVAELLVPEPEPGGEPIEAEGGEAA